MYKWTVCHSWVQDLPLLSGHLALGHVLPAPTLVWRRKKAVLWEKMCVLCMWTSMCMSVDPPVLHQPILSSGSTWFPPPTVPERCEPGGPSRRWLRESPSPGPTRDSWLQVMQQGRRVSGYVCACVCVHTVPCLMWVGATRVGTNEHYTRGTAHTNTHCGPLNPRSILHKFECS